MLFFPAPRGQLAECVVCEHFAHYRHGWFSSIAPPFIPPQPYHPQACRLAVFSLQVSFFACAFAFMAWPCCERSELASASGAARVWGADSPPGFAATESQGQFLAAGENLALRKQRFSLRSSSAVVEDSCLWLFCRSQGWLQSGYIESEKWL